MKAAEQTKHQSSPQLSLISGGQKYLVRKSFLIEKLRLFRDDPSRLNASEYHVRTEAPPEAFAGFLGFLDGSRREIVSGTVGSLRRLAGEFGFEELREKCEEFEQRRGSGCECECKCGGRCFAGFSISERFLKFEERESFVERRLAVVEGELKSLRERNGFLEGEVNRLSRELSVAESEILSGRRLFEGEQMYRRGCEYLIGTNGFGERGEELSQTLGFSYLKKSADLGHADAQYRIGKCLKLGTGCRQDLREAVRYFRLSADGGNSFAEWRFGLCLQAGAGVEKDEVVAFKHIKRSASLGNASGQNSLGFCLKNGRGTAKDLRGAFESEKQSMEQGNSWGQNSYGRCLAEGIGTGADPAAGVSIVKRAADQGLPSAQYNYAVYLETGTGVAQDRAQAAEYYRRAMEGGYSDAKAEYERCRQ
jgi:TPR repeat protein